MDTASPNRRAILAPGGQKEGVERRGDVGIGVQPVAWGSECVALHFDSEDPCRCSGRWDGHAPGIGVGMEEAARRTSKLVWRVLDECSSFLFDLEDARDPYQNGGLLDGRRCEHAGESLPVDPLFAEGRATDISGESDGNSITSFTVEHHEYRLG
jgi:hypothetical protein